MSSFSNKETTHYIDVHNYARLRNFYKVVFFLYRVGVLITLSLFVKVKIAMHVWWLAEQIFNGFLSRHYDVLSSCMVYWCCCSCRT
jgi:hypothetical protein